MGDPVRARGRGPRESRTGVVGHRPVTDRATGDPEPVITERDPGLAYGTWPGWSYLATRGMAAGINRGAVMAAHKAATAAAKRRVPLGPVHVGHLLAELDRVASAWYGERDGNAILKDQLADRPRRPRRRRV